MVCLEMKASSTALFLAGMELVDWVWSFDMGSPVAVSKLDVPAAHCMAGMDVAAMVAS